MESRSSSMAPTGPIKVGWLSSLPSMSHGRGQRREVRQQRMATAAGWLRPSRMACTSFAIGIAGGAAPGFRMRPSGGPAGRGQRVRQRARKLRSSADDSSGITVPTRTQQGPAGTPIRIHDGRPLLPTPQEIRCAWLLLPLGRDGPCAVVNTPNCSSRQPPAAVRSPGQWPSRHAAAPPTF